MKSFNLSVPFPVERVIVRRLGPVVEEELEPVGEGEEPQPNPNPTPAPFIPETLYDGSYDAGVRAGRKLALEEMEAARAAETRQVKEVLFRMNQVLEELLSVAEGHFPELMLTALGRVFREHQFTHEEMAGEVTALLREVNQAQSITIEGPAADINLLESRVEKMGLSIQHGRLQWKANAGLARGEYILQTDLGMVDGRRLSKLAQVRMALET